MLCITSVLYSSAQNYQWTWLDGDNYVSVDLDEWRYFFYQEASYGTPGVASPSNKPGCRYGAAGWQDNAGNFWLFGGYGKKTFNENVQNDLWKYDPVRKIKA